MTAATLHQPTTRIPVPAADALVAIAIALAVVAYHAASGFPTLADSGGDNDSILRLVRVRDLIAGQGWFDQTQYRMGLDGGFAMHWSRLVDLPIAALVLLLGERAALIVWPATLFAAAIFLVLRAARNVGEEFVALPAAVIGGLVLYYVNAFPPGALDHHNVQLVLALAMLVTLLRHAAPLACGVGSGICAALMLAVGMEAAPLVAVASLCVAIAFLFGGVDDTQRARGFGLGFGGTALLCFMLTVPAREWLLAYCDAFSIPQASLAVLGGAGLAAATALPASVNGRIGKAVALGMLAALAGAILVVAFPQCADDPFANLDPRLLRYWLSAVSEAQSVSSIVAADPAMFAGNYITPVVALIVMPFLWRRGESRQMATMATLLVAALIVSIWQVRGTLFSLPLAAIPLAAWVARARERVATRPTAKAQFAMVAAWLISFNIVWQAAARLVVPSAAVRVEAVASSEASFSCTAASDYEVLAELPGGTVLAVSNLGAPVLAHTHHRVLAGPYHRNVEGNLAALQLLMGDAAAAQHDMSRLGIDYVVHCPGNAETVAIRDWAPEGFLAALASGTVPPWLEAAGKESSMTIYRVATTQK